MSKRIDLRKYWANKAKQGRLGDSEMRVVKGEPSHVNPIEADIIDRHGKTGEEIVTQIGSGTINPKTGYREYVPWLAAAGLYGGAKLIGSEIKRRQEKKLIKAQKEAKLSELRAAGAISAEEAQAFARMRKGAEEGTMNVEKMTQQVAQPLYQQGQAQVAEQMGIITSQGLEGSIMAQEASRKVGADVRAKIAGQARQISLANERTKADSEKRYQDALMRRGQLLSDIAGKKAGVVSQAKIAQMESKQNNFNRMLSTVTNLGAKGLLQAEQKEEGGITFGEVSSSNAPWGNQASPDSSGGVSMEALMKLFMASQGTAPI